VAAWTPAAYLPFVIDDPTGNRLAMQVSGCSTSESRRFAGELAADDPTPTRSCERVGIPRAVSQ
jgi:hypothetical protein